jgi:hypothetical protein
VPNRPDNLTAFGVALDYQFSINTDGEVGESRDEALHLLAETSFSIPLPEPDVQVSKHPALYAWALARLWVGLRYV